MKVLWLGKCQREATIRYAEPVEQGFHAGDFQKTFLQSTVHDTPLVAHYTRRSRLQSKRCDGCKEIHHFLTDSNYRGDEFYPVGVEPDLDLGPNWTLGPDEMELSQGRN
jgi:hypothetical protein